MSTEKTSTTKKAGSVEKRGERWYGRVRLPDGSRPWVPLGPGTMSDAMAREKLAVLVEKGTETGRLAEWVHELRAKRMDPRRMGRRGRSGPAVAVATANTVRGFGERWTSGELFRDHGEVRGLKVKCSAKADGWRLGAYVYPVIGTKLVADVTEDDIGQVMREAPGRYADKNDGAILRQGTKRHIFQVLRRLFALAIRPGRLRTDNPVTDDFKPPRDRDDKLFGFLYPTELVQLLGCVEVPLGRRVLYALAAYTGLRKGSLLSLRWGGLNLEAGTLTSLHSKTRLCQLFEVEPSLVAVLRAWHEHNGKPDKDAPVICNFVDNADGADRLATTLREDLALAGVTRQQLFGGSDNIEPLRFHDLRATFVTWALRANRTKFWISDRTGHVTDSQLMRYARQARVLEDLRFDPFPDIRDAIPELSTKLSTKDRNGHLDTETDATADILGPGSQLLDITRVSLNPLAEGSSPSWPTHEAGQPARLRRFVVFWEYEVHAVTDLWNLAKGLRHAVAVRQRLLGPRRPSWDATYETLATVLHLYTPVSTRLSVSAQRRVAAGFFDQTGVVKETRYEKVSADGVAGEWFHNGHGDDGRVLYYLHGGGYVIGSVKSHRDLIARLSRACGARGFAIDYRLAPEHPFPAQLEDAVRAYRWLLEQGVAPDKLVIAGESAGGGLTLSTLVALRDEGTPLPAAAVLISPWVDLEVLGASVLANAPYDFVNRAVLESFASHFVTPAERRDPRAAPLHADLRGLPPLLVQAGGAEALLDDAKRVAERAAAAGVEVELDVWDDMIHAWHAFAPLIVQGRDAIEAVGAFVRRQLDA